MLLAIVLLIGLIYAAINHRVYLSNNLRPVGRSRS
jgi:hypothetical protein